VDQILLASSAAPLDLGPGRAFAVCARGWSPPFGIEQVAVDDVVNNPDLWFGAPGTMVVCGLSRILTASNRVRLGPALLRPRPGVSRVVVDDRLFHGEPWKAFWPLFAVGRAMHGYADSFFAESSWRRAHEMEEADPFSAAAIVAATRGLLRCCDPFTFAPVVEEVRPVEAGVLEEYAAEKARAFAEETTLQGILRRLGDFAGEVEPARSIPTHATVFRSRDVRIVRTDLPVDAYLAGRVRETIEITNAVAEAG
jgi:hypothetical protein